MIAEFFVLILLAAAAVAGAWLIGVRSFWLAFPLGLAMTMVLRVLSYALFHEAHLYALVNPVYFALLGATVIVAAWRAKLGQRLWQMIAPAVGVAVLAVVSTRVIGAQGTPHGDSHWILAVAHLFDINGNLYILGGHTPIKRGFMYPMMLALGPKDEYLSSFTPFIFAALGAAAVWLIIELSKKYDARRLWIVSGILAVTTFTAIMPLRSIFYINGHTTMGLGIMLTAAGVVIAAREGKLNTILRVMVLSGVFIIASARVEGIVLAAVAVLPLLSRRWILRRDIMLIVSAATIPLAIWLVSYHSYLIRGLKLPYWAFPIVLIGGGLIAAVKWLDWLRFRSVAIGVGAFAGIFIAAEIFLRNGLRQGNYALITNLLGSVDPDTGRFIQEGGWGLIVILLPVALWLGISFSRGKGFAGWLGLTKFSVELRTTLVIFISLVLSSMFAKMLDSGQFGSPTLGRPGWSDSLNRMWIHVFALMLVITAVALIENEKLWSWLPLKKSNETAKVAK